MPCTSKQPLTLCNPTPSLFEHTGRGGAREGGSSQSSSVVRVWELADAETKVQYAGHSAAVHKLAFLGPGSAAVASLDVSGAIHVWSRSTGKRLFCWCRSQDVHRIIPWIS
jgi:WD40 repeat protein